MLTRLVRTSTRSLRPLIRSNPISLNGRKMSLNQQVWYDQLNAPSPYISTSEALLPGYVPHGTYAKFNSPIDKSPNDDRSYRYPSSSPLRLLKLIRRAQIDFVKEWNGGVIDS